MKRSILAFAMSLLFAVPAKAVPVSCPLTFKSVYTGVARSMINYAVWSSTASLKEYFVMNFFNSTLAHPICRGASWKLQEILWDRFSIVAEAVTKNEGAHTFLKLKDFYEPGEHLYIDPTFWQFVPEENRPFQLWIGVPFLDRVLAHILGAALTPLLPKPRAPR